MKFKQRGFTLVELLVAGGVLVLLLVVGAIVLSSRVDVSAERRDAQRRIDVVNMAKVFDSYLAEQNQPPAGISTEEQFIGNGQGEFDLCAYLVPKYATDLPFDPLSSVIGDAVTCPADESDYITGYSIQQKDGKIILAAPMGETDQGIKLELDY